MKLTLRAGDRVITWPDVDPVRFRQCCQRIREECCMSDVTLPPELVALLATAEADLAAAVAADNVANASEVAANKAADQATTDHNGSLAAHQTATASASAAVEAIKKHFGLS